MATTQVVAIGCIDPFDVKVDRWPTYYERVEQYFKANSIKEDMQVATLLTLIGGSTYSLLKDLVAPDPPADKMLKEIHDALTAHLSLKPLLIAERFRFHRRQQYDGESVAQFLAALRNLVFHCDFVAVLNDTRDRFVCGLRSQAVQRKLLSEASLTLSKATEIASAAEAASRDAVELSTGLARSSPQAEVHRLPATNKSHARPRRSSATVATPDPRAVGSEWMTATAHAIAAEDARTRCRTADTKTRRATHAAREVISQLSAAAVSTRAGRAAM